jgi:hypothetical protein
MGKLIAARRSAFHAPTLAEARARCRRAYAATRKTDSGTATLVDRWYADTLAIIDGRPNGAAITMLVRTAIMFEVLVDRRGWPKRVRGVSGRHQPAVLL